MQKEANNLSAALGDWLRGLKVEDLFRTCLSCKNLARSGSGCNLYPGHPVPAHIVIAGCDKHEDAHPPVAISDDIPF